MRDSSSAVRIVSYLRALIGRGRDCLRVGSFVVGFDRDSDSRFRNYALPDDSCEPTETDIRALMAAFSERHRIPRLEYVPALAPAVLPALMDAGFVAEAEPALMVCSEATLHLPSPSSGIAFSLATDSSALLAAARVQNEAYGETDTTTAADVTRLRSTLDRGGAVGLASDVATGEAVGAGLYSAPLNSTTEIAAVGVRAPYRRRGIAGYLTAFLAQEALARGITEPFLMAAHEAEARIYSRVGFQPCGTMLHISRMKSAG